MQIPKFSPHDAEVLGTDAHLPPLSESRLSPLALRDHFSRPGLPQPKVVH